MRNIVNGVIDMHGYIPGDPLTVVVPHSDWLQIRSGRQRAVFLDSGEYFKASNLKQLDIRTGKESVLCTIRDAAQVPPLYAVLVSFEVTSHVKRAVARKQALRSLQQALARQRKPHDDSILMAKIKEQHPGAVRLHVAPLSGNYLNWSYRSYEVGPDAMDARVFAGSMEDEIGEDDSNDEFAETFCRRAMIYTTGTDDSMVKLKVGEDAVKAICDKFRKETP